MVANLFSEFERTLGLESASASLASPRKSPSPQAGGLQVDHSFSFEHATNLVGVEVPMNSEESKGNGPAVAKMPCRLTHRQMRDSRRVMESANKGERGCCSPLEENHSTDDKPIFCFCRRDSSLSLDTTPKALPLRLHEDSLLLGRNPSRRAGLRPIPPSSPSSLILRSHLLHPSNTLRSPRPNPDIDSLNIRIQVVIFRDAKSKDPSRRPHDSGRWAVLGMRPDSPRVLATRDGASPRGLRNLG